MIKYNLFHTTIVCVSVAFACAVGVVATGDPRCLLGLLIALVIFLFGLVVEF